MIENCFYSSWHRLKKQLETFLRDRCDSLWTVEAFWAQWTHSHVQETSLRWIDFGVFSARSSHQKMGTLWSWLGSLFNWSSADSNCARKISPPPLHQQQPGLLICGRMDPCCHVFTPNLDPTIPVSHQIRQLFSNLLFGGEVWIVASVLSWQ